MKKLLILFINLVMALSIYSQVITSDPILPLADESVTILFDASGTPLEGYSGTVYTHTGILKNSSPYWQHVIGDWGDNEVQPALTSLGNDKYSLEITPSIREYYGPIPTDIIDKMAFVFRSADALTQSEDLFLEVFEDGLQVSIFMPDQSPYFVDPGENIYIEANSIASESLTLYVDGIEVATTTETTITHTATAGLLPDTKSWIKVKAVAAGDAVYDSMYYYVRGETQVETLPPGVRDGINYIDDNTVTLVLHAPYKNSVYVHGGFNNWEVGPQYKMKRNTQSSDDEYARYWVTIGGLVPGMEYAFQYIIDEELYLADPYAEKILDQGNDPYISESVYPGLIDYPAGKTTGIVGVLETAQEEYNWQYDEFNMPKVTDMVVYELLVRDFTEAHTYKAVTDTLDYLQRLGVNVLELMPVNEFEGNSSWGYNPSFYFAPDKYYGPRDRLKELIDECHARDIAVVLDIVLNHSYYQSPLVQMYFKFGQPTAENPWYNPEHNFANTDAHWGFDFNHVSEHTRNFVDSVCSFWMSEYRFDGFRFDFTKGFSNTWHGEDDPWGSKYDAARIFHLQRISNEVWHRNPDAIVIMEHLAENSEEIILADHGILLWGNRNYNYAEASMGYNEGGKSDFSGISYQDRGWDYPHLLGYMESHDEERIMYKNLQWGNSESGYNIKLTGTGLDRIRLVNTFFYTVPGPKMLWQFGELGYDYSIDYNGRLGEKPVRWDYYSDWQRRVTYDYIAALIRLKVEHDVFETDDFSLDVSGHLKRIRLNDEEMNVVVLGNFDVVTGQIISGFQHTGKWYDYFTGDSLDVSDLNMLIELEPGESRLYTDVKLETPEIGLATAELPEDTRIPSFIYPNPVTNTAALHVELPERSDLSISVFNLYGSKVMEFENRRYDSGTHIIDLDTRELQAGIYFCRLSSLAYNDTVKFIKQ
jgi:glycosidase